MINFLHKPYPLETNIWYHIRFHLFMAMFVAFILIVFQPFGIVFWQDPHKTLKLIGYGVVAFVSPTLMLVLRYVVTDIVEIEKKYIVLDEMAWLIIVLFSVTFGNIFYSQVIGATDLSFDTFFLVFGIVLAIGIFPVTISVLLKAEKYRKINEKEAATINDVLHDHEPQAKETQTKVSIEEQKYIHLQLESKEITLGINNICYIESMSNYIRLAYVEGGNIKKEIYRSTLKSIEDQLQNSKVIRCHRSFMVNLDYIESISGNAQGYLITLKNTDDQVNVSRNFGPTVLEAIKNRLI
jgi:hypothetical protein